MLRSEHSDVKKYAGPHRMGVPLVPAAVSGGHRRRGTASMSYSAGHRSAGRPAAWVGRRLGALGDDQPATNCIASQLHSVAHPELLEHVGAVAVDRLLADEELLSDLLAGQPLSDQLHDLKLARGERVFGCGLSPRRSGRGSRARAL